MNSVRFRRRCTRRTRKGGALAAAMLFLVVISIASAALLSISAIHRVQIVRSGMDVRLMIAAEAGIETVRGRFVIVPEIQEDWENLVGGTGWNHIDDLVINGVRVRVEAHAIGGPSVPTARIRSTAFAGDRARTVEYTIKVATFSDYAVFNSSNEVSVLGADYKVVGNSYFGGSVDIPNPGAQLWGRSYMVGSVLQGFGPGNNPATGEPWTPPGQGQGQGPPHFPVEPPMMNEPPIPLPTWAAPWGAVRQVAQDMNHYWAENTVAIELRGTSYRRYFVRRTDASGATPSGTDWLFLSSASSLSPEQRLLANAQSIIGNDNYELTWEDHDIPDEGVIYVATGSVTEVNPADTDALAGSNNWRQHVPGAGSSNWGGNGTGESIPAGRGNDYDIVRNNGIDGEYAKVLLLWGNLRDRRVSIASEHKIILADNITYGTLLDNPHYRNFHGDSQSGKQSQGALDFKEMLGVMGMQDVHLTPTWWNRLPSSWAPGDAPGELVPGHFPGNAYAMDGVYLSLSDTRPWRFRNNPQGEFWGHGGLIAGGSYASGMGNHFARRNYDWDFRLQLTTPPFFLRAPNASATFLPGTWRTYEP
jgi:hypothetical protein